MKITKLQYSLIAAGMMALPALSADYVSHTLNNGALTIYTDEGKLKLTPQHDGAMEVFYQKQHMKQLPSYAIAGKPQQVATSVKASSKAITFTAGDMQAVVDKSPVRISYFYKGEPLVNEEVGFFATETMRGFRFELEDGEKLLGAGQRVLGMDRRGHRLPLYNRAHYGYETESKQMYFSLPAVMSSNKYSIMFDNSATGHIDLGATEADILQFEAVAGRTSYVVSAADSFPELVEANAEVTGLQPLPSRWSLGNFASRFGYRTQAEATQVVNDFIKKDIPLDAIVLDLYWFGKDIKGHMGNLDWDKEAWPDPEQMIADFKAKGVKTILISEPFVLTSSKRWEEAVQQNVLAKGLNGKPKTFDFYFGNTGLIDVFHKDGQKWLSGIYSDLADQGVAGWWGDLGEPEVHPSDTIHAVGSADEIHNAYGHQWAKMVAQFEAQKRPENRPFIMMRAGFLGSQRYGMIPWTGDVNRTWGGLKPQVELALQMGMFGFGYIHSDLGGFAGGETFDSELYTRWLQFGSFQPVYRPHGQEHIAPEPIFHDEKTQAIVKRFIKLRYQMLPYNYTLSFENSTKGTPLMRPVFYHHNDASLDNKDSYLWGENFLVTPVVDAGVETVNTELPKGVWFDYFNGQRFEGGKTVTTKTDIETLPVFVKAGSFIPMVASVQSADNYSSKALTLHHYVDASVNAAKGQMFEDDGVSVNTIESGNYRLFGFEAARADDNYAISINASGKGYQGEPQSRELTLVLHHFGAKPTKVTINNQSVDFDFDKSSGKLTVKTELNNNGLKLVVKS
ncbi:TIM-barrel domain-containing protein [Paraferrimonas sp. SM1919]|uniref:glycoside hydrolase family 31 protein n=1 Tax=Paraferrimonas sp. SM1919 TaxID=2662263 RepID=UPI0013D286D3|nr:TIM-barrel domain-containing protein [Paraferrimonas sp. SM1919]